MKKVLYLLFCLSLVQCGQKSNEPDAVAGRQPFFTFDQVDHYRFDITKNAFDSIVRNENKSRKDQGLLQILQQNIPVSTIDTLFIPNMALLNFRRTLVDPSKYEKLSELFSVNKTADVPAVACEPIFKDVLIFRQKSKVIGVAKIAFDCDKYYIIGSRYPTAGFGQDGEYTKLKELLKN